MAAEIRLFPCLTDNFGYLIMDPVTKATASIDAPEAAPVIEALEREGWTLTDILITHHHGDHVGGVAELKQKYNCHVLAPHEQVRQDRQCRYPRRAWRRRQGRRPVRAGTGNAGPYAGSCQLCLRQREGAVCRRHAVLDRLRAGVRGHLSAEMWDSLLKLRALPDDFKLYCGTKYAANVKFALTIEPRQCGPEGARRGRSRGCVPRVSRPSR